MRTWNKYTRVVVLTLLMSVTGADAQTLWEIGEPTDEEQLFLELINRSRADPVAESFRHANTTDPDILSSYSFFSLNTGAIITGFATIETDVPPLAMNKKLLMAARLHNADMFANVFQGHTSSTNPPPPNMPGDEFWDRFTRQNYGWAFVGENSYAYGESVAHVHAGFDVDWGSAPDGIQNPAGHRTNIHNSAFKEVGIGLLRGVNTSGEDYVGPLLCTQDFAQPSGGTTFVTGVIHFDLDGDQFYSTGEGIEGFRIDVTGSSFYAFSAGSGGYAIPVQSNGNYQVTLSAPGFASVSTNIAIVSSRNVKVDFVPAFVDCDVSGPTSVVTGVSTPYSCVSLPGATDYTFKEYALVTSNWVEGSESGTNTVTLDTNGDYPIIQSVIKASGSFAFHLAHTNPPIVMEAVTLSQEVYPQGGALLTFESRLGWATSTQIAKVQVSTDQGANWETVFSQAGTGGSGEAAFSERSVSLSAYTNEVIRLRFLYEFESGSLYNSALSSVGWYVDDITVSNALIVTGAAEQSTGGAAIHSFTAPQAGTYLIQALPKIEGRNFPSGDALLLTALPAPLMITMSSATIITSSNTFEMNIGVTNGAVSNLMLQMATNLPGNFTNLPGVVLTPLGNGQYRVAYTNDGLPRAYFRVRGED